MAKQQWTRHFNPNRVSIHDLRARLGRLDACDLSILSVSQVEARVKRILDQIPFNTYHVATFGLFRDRSGVGYTKASQLWYPPAGVAGVGQHKCWQRRK